MVLELESLSTAQKQNYLQHAIAPRPICFASTIDAQGQANLSPFSFFNLFSANPPVVVFSPSNRVRDNSPKHTLLNVLEIPEVVINIMDYDMVHQASLSSCDYPRGTSEFVKAGFTEEKALKVRPPMVRESKIKLECRVTEVRPLGHEGGAGNLVIAEVICMHINDAILDDNGQIDPHKMRHVARMGGDWYSVVTTETLFKVPKPNREIGMGIEALPINIRQNPSFSGNQLAQLANFTEIPAPDPSFQDDHVKQIVQYYSLDPVEMDRELVDHARNLLDKGNVYAAWQVLLALNQQL